MPENNKKEKVRSVFNYKYFQIALALPLALGCTLMIFIWCNDNLSLEWPSKKSLDTFLSYMSVPLWVMGSSIPLATLAAANFRAIQFQENLNFQKRNTERQEFEHALDLYHKELSIFKEQLASVIVNLKFEIIKPEDVTSIYTCVFTKPVVNCNKPLNYNLDTLEAMSDFMKRAEKLIVKLDNFSLKGETLARYYLKKVAPKHYRIDIEKLAKNVDIDKIKIALLINWFSIENNTTTRKLGIKCLALEEDKASDILKFLQEVIDLYQIIYNSVESKSEFSINYHGNKFLHHFCKSKIQEWKKSDFNSDCTLKLIVESWGF